MIAIIGTVLLAVLSFPSAALAQHALADAGAARPLRIVHDGGTVDGTCVLVYADSRVQDVMLYFITSARLFKTPQGEPLPPARAIRIIVDDGIEVEVRREDVFLPIGNLVDVAVIRAEAPFATFTPGMMTFDAPAPGSDFLIAGFSRGGAPTTLAGRARFVSSRFVVGDRDASGLAGCVGAPAVSDEGIYGVVGECDPNRAPVITLLSTAYSLITRHVPGLMGRPTLREQR
jgi:hypothetical protein